MKSIKKTITSYAELLEKINSEPTGIAKGYKVYFLQDKFVCMMKTEQDFDALIARDLEMFKRIEKRLLESEKPNEGEFVEYGGGMARICSTKFGEAFQLSNTVGVFVHEIGRTEASGCTWDPDVQVDRERLKFSNLIPTNKTQKGICWTFSDGEIVKDGGVYFEIEFKVWSLGGVR